MKYFTIVLFIAGTLKAQTYTLEQFSNFEIGTYPNADFVKDSNGLLDKYVGAWKGNDNGITYEFKFQKKENVSNESNHTKWDKIFGSLRITEGNGSVVFDSSTLLESDNFFRGINFQKDLKYYIMNFTGNKTGCVDYGLIYINVMDKSPGIMTLYFVPDYDIVSQSCANFNTTLPSKKVLYLNKK